MNTKGSVWLIVSLSFLIIVHFLFKFPAPCKELEAVWGAGDLITFSGTIVLGYISYSQTKYANEMAKTANKVSEELIRIQEQEYYPVLTVNNFVGILKDRVDEMCIENNKLTKFQGVIDEEIYVAYSWTLIDENFNSSVKIHTMSYEICFMYLGKFVIKNIEFKSIIFIGNDFEKEFKIENSNDLKISLSDQQELRLLFYIHSNENFDNTSSKAHSYITSNQIKFEIEMILLNNQRIEETIVVNKIDVDKKLKKKAKKTVYDEMFLSASYDVRMK